MKIDEIMRKVTGRKQKSGTAIVQSKIVVVDHYKNFTQNKDIVANVFIPPSLFTAMVGWFAEGGTREISGYAVLSSEGEMTWTTYTDLGTGGFVENGTDGLFSAMSQAMQGGHGMPNCHWHTHPNMGTFYSSTDKEHHAHRAEGSSVGTDMTYIVFDSAYWLCRRVIVGKDGKCTWNDGEVFLGDSDSPLPSEHKFEWVGWQRTYQPSPIKPVVNEEVRDQVCEDCAFELYGLSSPITYDGVCSICGKSASRLTTGEEQFIEIAEEYLDEYISIVETDDGDRALEFLFSAELDPYLEEILNLVGKRPKLLENGIILEHISFLTDYETSPTIHGDTYND